MKHLTLAAAFALLAAPALANQCPADMAAIDAALAAGTDLTEEQATQVQALRDEGAQQHEAGDHAASMATLAEAKGMLGLE
ncbi:hypothetical protein [Paracoccus marinaquae]|uniref:Uncharacterized protein n=1 Tax=Paracoccus marinaquae TaxID=2841926 RepID=A0ABS6AS44_9RHOB|nr:hypothetical protein [Paracoccus marinaquae]MBU3032439.1 hypothetical protein [Paracoccus marinaquae]